MKSDYVPDTMINTSDGLLNLTVPRFFYKTEDTNDT